MSILFGFLSVFVFISVLIAVAYLIVRATRKSEDMESLTVKETLVDSSIFISLITSIISLISIIFSAIDKKFVDVLKADYYSATVNEDIRVAASIILVSFPIYLALAYYRANYLKNNPARRDIKAIKYVNYITLVMASLFIVGSIVTTIYQYLGGELGATFGYKLLTILIISAALFAYNYYALRRDYDNKSNVPNILTALSLIAVMGSIWYSISILGSPAEVRRIKFDEKRLTDLSNIQNQILSSWTQNKVLPANIADIKGDGFNYAFILPVDPRTKDPYTYKVIENSKYVKSKGQDCATFYPSKFNNYNNNGSYDVSKLTCEIPSKATFEVCANFETIRVYDANGIEQTTFDRSSPLGVKGLEAGIGGAYFDIGYGYDGYTKNANLNHDKGNYCFKRTINPLKYPQY
jgi:hypothetical protein